MSLLGSVRRESRLLVDVTRVRVDQLRFARTGRHVGTRALVNSLPKSGTNLLIKAVDALPGMRRVHVAIHHKTLTEFRAAPHEPVVTIGVDWPAEASQEAIRNRLARVPSGSFATAHVPYSSGFDAIMRELGMCMVLIVRDPRDVALSNAEYLATRREHFFYDHFRSLNEEARIMASLTGVRSENGGRELKDIRSRVNGVVEWTAQPYVYLTQFEKLVGPAGGGDRETQLAEIGKVAHHLGLACSDEEIERVADSVYGGTHTFRTGRIGRWREHFTQDHIDVARPMLDDVLAKLGYEDGWSS